MQIDRFAAPLMALILYTNAAVVAVHYHDVPFVVAASYPLLLLAPIVVRDPVGPGDWEKIEDPVHRRVASLLVGTASLGDLRKLGRIGGKTLAFYMSTTAIAVTIGLVLGNVIRPGAGVSDETRDELANRYGGAALDRMDRSYIEASLDLGATQARTLFTIVVPLAKAGIISGIIITFIPALGSFLTPDLLGGTDSQMIANVIERQFKSANDWPFGAALSFILLYATFGALLLRAILARGSSAMEAG